MMMWKIHDFFGAYLRITMTYITFDIFSQTLTLVVFTVDQDLHSPLD